MQEVEQGTLKMCFFYHVVLKTNKQRTNKLSMTIVEHADTYCQGLHWWEI